jgi:hypothetical protein
MPFVMGCPLRGRDLSAAAVADSKFRHIGSGGMRIYPIYRRLQSWPSDIEQAERINWLTPGGRRCGRLT